MSTLLYFLTWGVIYGVFLGAFSGTAIFPIIGTMAGGFFGLGIGIAGGMIAGLTAILTGAAHVDPDTDLAVTRRQTARRIGTALVVVPLLLWLAGVLLGIDFDGLEFTFAFILPWGGLAAAHTAHRFPDVVIRRLMKSKRGQLYAYDEGLTWQSDSVVGSIIRLWREGQKSRPALIGLCFGLLAALIHSLSFPLIGFQDFVSAFGGLGLLGAFGGAAFWAYSAIGAGTFLTFLKRLVFQDYFPHLPAHWTRNILTATAFVFTLGATWWATLFAFIPAIFTAYIVYRSLALPDESPEKGKRKEKNDAGLKHKLDLEPVDTSEADLYEDDVPSLSDLLK